MSKLRMRSPAGITTAPARSPMAASALRASISTSSSCRSRRRSSACCAIANSTRRRCRSAPHRVAHPRQSGLHPRHPGLPVAPLPPQRHLHLDRERHPRAKDLIDSRIGVPEYQLTAPVWQRGILRDEYASGPPASSISPAAGGPGREEEEGSAGPAAEIPRARHPARQDAVAHAGRGRDRRYPPRRNPRPS